MPRALGVVLRELSSCHPMRQATLVTFPFSSRTIGVLVRVIDRAYTDTEIGTLLLEAEADQWGPQGWPNKQGRLQWVFSRMREDPGANVEGAALELVRLGCCEGRSYVSVQLAARVVDWRKPPTAVWSKTGVPRRPERHHSPVNLSFIRPEGPTRPRLLGASIPGAKVQILPGATRLLTNLDTPPSRER